MTNIKSSDAQLAAVILILVVILLELRNCTIIIYTVVHKNVPVIFFE